MCTGTGPSVLLKQSKTLALHVHVFNVNIMCIPVYQLHSLLGVPGQWALHVCNSNRTGTTCTQLLKQINTNCTPVDLYIHHSHPCPGIPPTGTPPPSCARPLIDPHRSHRLQTLHFTHHCTGHGQWCRTQLLHFLFSSNKILAVLVPWTFFKISIILGPGQSTALRFQWTLVVFFDETTVPVQHTRFSRIESGDRPIPSVGGRIFGVRSIVGV